MSQETATTRDVELFDEGDRDALEQRWQDIQAKFVDEPRSSVAEANTLVGDLMERLVRGFDEERGRLESQWDRGDEVSTEELRLTLQRYRGFFGRLLDVRGA